MSPSPPPPSPSSPPPCQSPAGLESCESECNDTYKTCKKACKKPNKKACTKDCKQARGTCKKTCNAFPECPSPSTSPPSPSPSPPPPSPSPPPPSPSAPPPSPSPPPPSPPPPSACIFTTKASLMTEVQAYNANPTAATAKCGPIADWDVSAITDMGEVFSYMQNFNADVSNWDTSSVTTMNQMFFVRSTPVLPPICSRALHCTLDAVAPVCSHPRPASYALLSTLGSPRRRSTSR
eukprot:scaffold91555_cov51-Phaeocystis_antarctica.AAC.2